MCPRLPPETRDVDLDGMWFWSWCGRPPATSGLLKHISLFFSFFFFLILIEEFRMRRFNKLKKSFPFLANFHVYRVSFVPPLADLRRTFLGREDIGTGPPDSPGQVGLSCEGSALGSSPQEVVLTAKVPTEIEGRACVCERELSGWTEAVL